MYFNPLGLSFSPAMSGFVTHLTYFLTGPSWGSLFGPSLYVLIIHCPWKYYSPFGVLYDGWMDGCVCPFIQAFSSIQQCLPGTSNNLLHMLCQSAIKWRCEQGVGMRDGWKSDLRGLCSCRDIIMILAWQQGEKTILERFEYEKNRHWEEKSRPGIEERSGERQALPPAPESRCGEAWVGKVCEGSVAFNKAEVAAFWLMFRILVGMKGSYGQSQLLLPTQSSCSFYGEFA